MRRGDSGKLWDREKRISNIELRNIECRRVGSPSILRRSYGGQVGDESKKVRASNSPWPDYARFRVFVALFPFSIDTPGQTDTMDSVAIGETGFWKGECYEEELNHLVELTKGSDA